MRQRDQERLIFAIENGDSLQRIRSLVKNDPVLVRQRCYCGNTILHVTCASCRDIAIVQYLYQQYPEAVEITDDRGELPLHIAAEWCRFDVVQFLVEKYPESVRVRDSHGRMALHYACRGLRRVGSGTEVKKVKFLVGRYPGAILQRDYEHGYSPIHYSVLDYFSNKRTIQVLKTLLKLEPFALLLKGSQADAITPLALAKRNFLGRICGLCSETAAFFLNQKERELVVMVKVWKTDLYEAQVLFGLSRQVVERIWDYLVPDYAGFSSEECSR